MKVSDGCVLGDGDKEDMKPDFYGNDESWAKMSAGNAGNAASSPAVIL